MHTIYSIASVNELQPDLRLHFYWKQTQKAILTAMVYCNVLYITITMF
jgi:hypothetical protein